MILLIVVFAATGALAGAMLTEGDTIEKILGAFIGGVVAIFAAVFFLLSIN